MASVLEKSVLSPAKPRVQSRSYQALYRQMYHRLRPAAWSDSKPERRTGATLGEVRSRMYSMQAPCAACHRPGFGGPIETPILLSKVKCISPPS